MENQGIKILYLFETDRGSTNKKEFDEVKFILMRWKKITVKMEIELTNVLNVKTGELTDVAEFMNLLKAKGKKLDVEDMIKCWKKGCIEEDGVVAPIEEKSDAQKRSAAHAVDDLDTKKRRALASGADIGFVFACDICNVVSVGTIPSTVTLLGKDMHPWSRCRTCE